MTKAVWLRFPKPPAQDPAWPIPPPLAPPEAHEIEVHFEARIRLSTREGPIPSQAGTLLDVIADMARDAGAGSGELYASWKEEQRNMLPGNALTPGFE
jgi:hypothetical protein